ncbi:MAG: CRISPR-associated endonuclease Cas1 [Bacteroidales bacterium]
MDLILNSHGTVLTKDIDCFVVIHKDGRKRIPPNQLKSISVGRGVQISSDAALLAIEREIEILFVDHSGEPKGRVWSSRYGSISTIRKGQLEFTHSSKAVEWIKEVVLYKISNQQALLLTLTLEVDEYIDKQISRLEEYKANIGGLTADSVNDISPSIRGWEGNCSRIYFETINRFLPDDLRFERRTIHPAQDIFNALLNYGYGVMYGKVEGALIRSGIDPYIGIMHRDDYNRPVLVYDVIERFRIWVDFVVLSICMQNIISEECYSIRSDGSCWLEALGKRILIQSLNDYLDDVVIVDSLSRSRISHIDLYCQNLAQQFKRINK